MGHTGSAGMCAGRPERRVVLVTGDGAHQLTVQEVGVMGFMQIKPVVIVLNNGLYGVEALISETGHAYNVLPAWRYADIPAALDAKDGGAEGRRPLLNWSNHWPPSMHIKELPILR